VTRRAALRASLVGAAAALVAGTAAAPAAVAADDRPHVVCRFSDPRLVEISGITWSRRHPGVYWVHNDSGGGPYLYAVDGTTCRTLARIRIGNIGARDLEGVATGTDPQDRPVLWLGDIGDNRDSWPSVRLHAVTEPARLVDQQVDAVTYRFTYADIPHNAEGIIASPDRAQVWVVTKQLAAGTVWRVPLSTSRLTRGVAVGDVGGIATDAAMSRDGRHYVVRDYLRAFLYDAPVSAASLAAPTRVELPFEVQGEAVTFAPGDQALLVAGERQAELWWVPLAVTSADATSQPSASGSATPVPSTVTLPPGATATGSASVQAGSAGSGAAVGPVGVALAVAALAGAIGVAVVAARRMRH
jgi:hypothetical protein